MATLKSENSISAGRGHVFHCMCFAAAWGSKVQHQNRKLETLKLEILILAGKGYLFRCICSAVAWEQQCYTEIENHNKFWFLHSTACAILLHGDQNCNIEIGNHQLWNQKFQFSQGKATCSIACALLPHREQQCNAKIGNQKIFRFSTFCCICSTATWWSKVQH